MDKLNSAKCQVVEVCHRKIAIGKATICKFVATQILFAKIAIIEGTVIKFGEVFF
jgi:hypothetical protein